LPDQLFDETLGDTGDTRQLEMIEFNPSQLYIEQIMRVFPREYGNRLKISPAFEETLMRYEEAKGGSAGSKAAGAGGGGMPSLGWEWNIIHNVEKQNI